MTRNRRTWVASVLLLTLCLVFGASQASAQALYGSIVGNVTDSSNAAVPGATVRITHQETNQSRQSVTNEVGGYNFPTLPGGSYDVAVSKEGFQTFTRRHVVVSISSVVRVDATLQVGAVTESIQVAAQAATLQTDRAEVRSEVTTKDLEELPVPPNRNYQNLLIMVPGFSPPANTGSLSANPSRALNFSVNGTTTNSNNIRIEGATATNVWMPHVSAYVPGLEAIQTLSVVTSSLDAEQGLTGGAAINVQMKSGTNQLHGSLFEYHTNNAMKAKPFFLPAGERNPKAIDNQLGGTVGGPIKKDKLFYFFGYDGQFIRQNAATYTTVATAAIRAGDMSASPNPIYDPLTGKSDGSGKTALPDKKVPQSRIDPIVPKLLPLTPLPTWPQLLTNNYYASGSYRVSRHKFDTKLNWNASQKVTLSGRLGVLDYSAVNPNVFGDNGGPVSSAGGRDRDLSGSVLNSTIAATYVLKPTFIVDAYFGWTRLNTLAEPPHLDEKLGLEYLKLPGTNGPTREYGGYPSFSVSNYTAFGKSSNSPIYYLDPAYDYVVNANWTRGSHNVRFGADVARQANNNWEVGGGGSFSFSGGSTTNNPGSPNQFNSYADFLMGFASGASNSVMVEDRATTRTWAYSLYLRDQWQASRKLTLSLGLRWDYFPMGVSKDRGFRRYDWNTDNMWVCGEGSIPRDCGVKVPKLDFSPRLGIAYRATETFVIRTGFGINFDPQPLAFARDLIGTGERTGSAAWPASPNSFTARSILKDGIPPMVVPDISSGVIQIPLTQSFATPPDRYRMGYIESWNFTLQKQLKWRFIGQAGYVASRQIKQLQYLNLNVQRVGAGRASQPFYQKFGRTGDTNVITNYGHNSYDSLQSTLIRSFANGVQFSAVYTFSKGIGMCCDQLSDKNPAIQDPAYLNLNKALWAQDRTHILNISTVAELPFGPGRRWLNGGGWTSALARGWQTNLLFSSYSGRWFSVSASGTSLNASGNTQRADQVKPKVAMLGGVGPGQSFFDPLAFAPVTEARFGTAGFNTLRGPGLVNLDFGLVREFRIGERWQAQFRGEALNFTNTPHFGNPSGNVSNLQLNPDGTIKNLGGYTVITSTTGVGREGIDERVLRISLRVRF